MEYVCSTEMNITVWVGLDKFYDKTFFMLCLVGRNESEEREEV